MRHLVDAHLDRNKGNLEKKSALLFVMVLLPLGTCSFHRCTITVIKSDSLLEILWREGKVWKKMIDVNKVRKMNKTF